MRSKIREILGESMNKETKQRTRTRRLPMTQYRKEVLEKVKELAPTKDKAYPFGYVAYWWKDLANIEFRDKPESKPEIILWWSRKHEDALYELHQLGLIGAYMPENGKVPLYWFIFDTLPLQRIKVQNFPKKQQEVLDELIDDEATTPDTAKGVRASDQVLLTLMQKGYIGKTMDQYLGYRYWIITDDPNKAVPMEHSYCYVIAILTKDVIHPNGARENYFFIKYDEFQYPSGTKFWKALTPKLKEYKIYLKDFLSSGMTFSVVTEEQYNKTDLLKIEL